MAATEARLTPKREDGFTPCPIASGAKIFQGTQCAIDAGFAVPATGTTGLLPLGRARKTYDNTDGDDGLDADGNAFVGEFESGEFCWDNGDSITQADVGKDAYMFNDTTVKKTGTDLSWCGKITAVDARGVFVLTPKLPGLTASTGASLSTATPAPVGSAAAAGGSASDVSKSDHIHAPWTKVTHTIDDTITGSADTNGTANTPINVGSALPAGALVCAAVLTLTTQGSGGSVVSADCDVGWSGAADALIDGVDLVGSTGAGAKYVVGAGTSALFTGRPLPAGGKQITITVTPDGSHKLSALTALSATVDVYYVVQP